MGHGTASAEAFTHLVGGLGIDKVIDVRRFPGSRRHPHLAKDEMAAWLMASDISYRWLPALGGRRGSAAGSRHVALRNLQFRAYADHMEGEEFEHGVRDLLDAATRADVGVMCSESVWWRCHRRLLADYLVLIAGVEVEHVLHDGRRTAHPVTAGARRAGRHVVYDVVD